MIIIFECILKQSQHALIMKIMKKYGVVESYDKKGFELSRTFATVLASNDWQHPNLLVSISYAIKSYAQEASDSEKIMMCSHLAMHLIPKEKRSDVLGTLFPLLEEMSKEVGSKSMFDMVCERAKDDNKYR